MASERKFYETLIGFRVLSEEPIPHDMAIDEIYHESQHGGYVVKEVFRAPVVINGIQAANKLTELGSEPAFYGLDDTGDDLGGAEASPS